MFTNMLHLWCVGEIALHIQSNRQYSSIQGIIKKPEAYT